MSNLPLVSICIPTYNGSKHLHETLNSILEQTYNYIEVIVSDDDSSDNTLDIIDQFGKTFDKPCFVYNHKPAGIGANWNNSVEKANGKYIKFLFQDDTLEPSCIEEMVAVLENYPKIGLVASKRNFLCDKDYLETEVIKDWLKKYQDLQTNLELTQDYLSIITKKVLKQPHFYRKSPLNFIGEPPVVLYRKDIVNNIGGFNSELKQTLDYEYWFRILKNHDIAILNKPLVNFRLHDEQATNINRVAKVDELEMFRMILLKRFFLNINFLLKITLIGVILKNQLFSIFNFVKK